MTQKDTLEAAQEQISNLETTITALQEGKAELQAKISEIIAERETSVAALESKNQEQASAIATLEAEAKTAEARAREISARMQVNLPEKPAQAGETNSSKTLTRSAFEQLSHSERSTFIKGGGRLTND